MSKRILITGGAGFIGANLALFLKESQSGAHVICYDSCIRQGSRLNIARLKKRDIPFIKGDVRDRKKLFSIKKVDLIIDCCAEPSVLAGYTDPTYTIETNFNGTVNCLELARRDKADFIFLSTSRVYSIEAMARIPFEELPTRFDWKKDVHGPGYSYRGIDPSFTLRGIRSLYGASKLCSEFVAQEYFQMFGIRGIINRLGMVAGPWQMGRVDQGLVGFWASQLIYGRPLSYIGYGGTGKQVRDILHVDDVCDLVSRQIKGIERFQGHIFNAGGGRGNAISLCELNSLIMKITGTTSVIKSNEKNRRADIRIYITDNRLVKQHTGWSPHKGLDNIVEDTVRWIKGHQKILQKVLC